VRRAGAKFSIAGLGLVCVLSLLCLTACDRLPESYPPPEQQPPVGDLDAVPNAMMVSMDSPDSDRLIVKDIYAGGMPWRWTRNEPTVRVPLLSTENLKFSVDFTLWDETFKVTGPVEISFLVNGELLDKVLYATSGSKHFEKPVPADWLRGNEEATLALSIGKVYVSYRDASKFGVILTRLGLEP